MFYFGQNTTKNKMPQNVVDTSRWLTSQTTKCHLNASRMKSKYRTFSDLMYASNLDKIIQKALFQVGVKFILFIVVNITCRNFNISSWRPNGGFFFALALQMTSKQAAHITSLIYEINDRKNRQKMQYESCVLHCDVIRWF